MIVELGGNRYEIVAFVCKSKTAVVKRGRRWYLFNPKPNKVTIQWVKKFAEKAIIMFYAKMPEGKVKPDTLDSSSSNKSDSSSSRSSSSSSSNKSKSSGKSKSSSSSLEQIDSSTGN
jgi:hypothetical protein